MVGVTKLFLRTKKTQPMDNRRLAFSVPQQPTTSIFKNIKDLKINEYASIIVLVKGHLEPTKSKGTDYVTTVDVIDELGDALDIKIFTKTPRFANFFHESDIIRIPSVKLIGKGKAVTGHGSNMEVLAHLNEEGTRVFVTESEKAKINKLREYTVNHQVSCAWPLLKIKDIKEYCSFSLVGMLISIREETPSLTVLLMVDYTASPLIKNIVKNARFCNDMTLYIKVWGNRQEKNFGELRIGKVYRIRKIRTDKLGMTLEARISETFFEPLIPLDEKSPEYQTIIEAKKKFYGDDDSTKTQNVETKIPEKYELFSLCKITDIKAAGVYRIRVKILLHYPFLPIEAIICRKCNFIQSEDYNFKCTTSCKRLLGCTPIKEKILKIQVKDASGFICIVLKNKLVEKFIQLEENLRKENLDCIVLYKNGIFFMLDANFDIA
ncbi:putative Nucleic acid-binding, OB-fold, Nucleic acid-binding, OB-fold-like protein [Trachipleistophora hominis]|uniref:Putative Nucleic acid-binding, OB-fold, Nucleic acid-binding, OB-fold-like protein n=1 Tax=Trachipleistophora hominis TaxID=72359 RepID=L7JTU7_TRAHO|nr:putative Nucleic acid-binding, OB-fold, Nucleic acid-binding, OB-fold-like protein [Trachipleistophora hominis]